MSKIKCHHKLDCGTETDSNFVYKLHYHSPSPVVWNWKTYGNNRRIGNYKMQNKQRWNTHDSRSFINGDCFTFQTRKTRLASRLGKCPDFSWFFRLGKPVLETLPCLIDVECRHVSCWCCSDCAGRQCHVHTVWRTWLNTAVESVRGSSLKTESTMLQNCLMRYVSCLVVYAHVDAVICTVGSQCFTVDRSDRPNRWWCSCWLLSAHTVYYSCEQWYSSNWNWNWYWNDWYK